MKNGVLTLILIIVGTTTFAQSGYKKVYKYNQLITDLALVKTISNTYGFIDRNGKTVVQPVYKKIDKFNYNEGQLALVQNISGAYGFINRSGEEIIQAIYWSKKEALEQLKTLQ